MRSLSYPTYPTQHRRASAARSVRRGGAALAVLSALLLSASLVCAQTGVSEDRVSLPEGPGSLEGIGENVEMDPNMGNMTYSVVIDVPKGFDAVTPELALSYSSGGSGSVVGMGWSMSTPSIERMTYRGLPEYDADDDFCSGGSDQLVRLPGTSPPVYRNRYEKSFTRYTWMQVGDGSEGYWVAEYSDGSKGYFGATSDGTLVADARMGTEDTGTFRYMLVEKVDVYGHRLTYTYSKIGGLVPLVTSIGYGYVANPSTPTYQVEITYQERMDDTGVDYLSDAKAGFNELLTQRVSRIDVFARGTRIRTYRLAYEPYDVSGGFTRLARVERVGVEQGVYPVAFDFAYTQTLGGICNPGDDCQRPQMIDMGSLGVSLASGQATLIDINGDALPDVIDTSENGPHRFFLNIPSTDGTSAFDPSPIASAVGNGADFRLGSAGTQTLDANGDGFSDLLNAANGQVLINRGLGDWVADDSFANTEGLAEALNNDFEDGELRGLRFIDYNGDKRIDLMRSTQTETTFLENQGGDAGFVPNIDVDTVGAGFAQDAIQLSDINGDGLQDVVQVLVGQLRYRLNYGWGRWGDWVVINGLPVTEAEIGVAELEDLNGDGMADFVVVSGGVVKYALNRNTTTFTAPTTLTTNDVNGDLPDTIDGTTVLFADMNANGSSDIVWINTSGDVEYLELFPVRPNLLTRITNGIGQVTDITYSSSVVQMALDGGLGAWQYKLPHPMLVVDTLDQYDLLTDVHEITTYRYHDGFYDGVEKQFRGYERVDMTLQGDATVEEGLTNYLYDVGATDTYRNGLTLREAVASAGRPLQVTENTFDECDVAEVPDGTELPIKHICQTATQTTLQEGAPEAEWVVTGSTSDYDGYGNVTLQADLGVISVGGQGCGACAAGRDADEFGAPCDRGGAQCVGDEMYTETEYAIPGPDTSDRWIISAAYRERMYGRPEDSATRFKETLTYYDGADFQGQALGTLDQGNTTRVTNKINIDSPDVIQSERNAYDIHGNVIETIDPNGDPDDLTGHRRRFAYDEDALRVVRADLIVTSPEGETYALRRDMTYEPLFDKTATATEWMRVVGDTVVSARRDFTYLYDEFGRMVFQVKPGGDSPASPTETYQFDLGNPTSRIITRKRTEVGGRLDIESIGCFDGRGRMFQTRTKLDDGLYQVNGFEVYNVREELVRKYQPYQSSSADCDTAPPEGVRFTAYRYDATFRVLEVTHPDGELYGTPSVERTTYAPLTTLTYDQSDTDPSSPYADTPVITQTDGMERTVSIERVLEAGLEGPTTRFHYDPLGRLTGYTDADGNRKVQDYDLLDRVVRILDPNTVDETLYAYDDAGNEIRMVDDRGIVTLTDYDGLNRPVRTWDEADPEGTEILTRYDIDPDCDAAECTYTENKIASQSYPGPDGTRMVDRMGFDLRGRPAFNARSIDGVRLVQTSAYDNADRLVGVTYPNGRTLERRYDGMNRLIEIEDYVDDIVYDERNLVNAITHGDGTSTVMMYDALMRPEENVTTGPDSLLLQGFAYTRDRNGNLTAIDDVIDAAPGRADFNARYAYDAWYRLLDANLSPDTDKAETITLGFDAIDNITAQRSNLPDSPANVGAYGYGEAPNAVLSAGDLSFGYDPAGYMNQRNAQTMTWDFKGRMTSASQGGAVIAEFLYGPDQSRVAKREGDRSVVYLNTSFEVRDGISTLYVRTDDKRVARVEDDALATTFFADQDDDGQITAADAWLGRDDAEAGGALWSSVRRLLIETGPADGTTYLHHDHLGSITLATYAEGDDAAIAGQRSFYPLGTVREQTGYVDEYGFTGQEIDRSTGLIHFDWRYYDPAVGRWLSVDPKFGTTDTDNLSALGEATTAYNYVAGNVVNAFDPTGLNKKSSVKSKMAKTAVKKTKQLGKKTKEVGKKMVQKTKEVTGFVRTPKKVKTGKESTKPVEPQLNPKLETKTTGDLVLQGVVTGVETVMTKTIGNPGHRQFEQSSKVHDINSRRDMNEFVQRGGWVTGVKNDRPPDMGLRQLGDWLRSKGIIPAPPGMRVD